MQKHFLPDCESVTRKAGGKCHLALKRSSPNGRTSGPVVDVQLVLEVSPQYGKRASLLSGVYSIAVRFESDVAHVLTLVSGFQIPSSSCSFNNLCLDRDTIYIVEIVDTL